MPTKCPKCDSDNTSDSKFCKECGTQLMPAKEVPEVTKTLETPVQELTLGSAYASFEEEIKGSLKEGKLADIVVLSKDVFTIPEEEILNTDVVYTILGGKIIYSSEAE
ncbi:MAG: amidohydrolase family protein [Candidatus Aminicenantes bacterium]|nr:amidohydrolase family protein [Candidatus Aminicenantes bacterium]